VRSAPTPIPLSAADGPQTFTCRTLAELDRDVDARFAAVGPAWLAVARDVAQSPLAALAAPLQHLQECRAALDRAVSDVSKNLNDARAIRDRAAAALVAALEAVLALLPNPPVAVDEWRTKVDAALPVAFRMPADVEPLLWRDFLADFDLHAEVAVLLDLSMTAYHAMATASLSMFLATQPSNADFDVMRDELRELQSSHHMLFVKNLTSKAMPLQALDDVRSRTLYRECKPSVCSDR
jgi:hypothetical protein